MEGEWKDLALEELVEISTDKVELSTVEAGNYISTDNMLPNFGGIAFNSNKPSVSKTSRFRKDEILFSNIRTYFRKLWIADRNGACSNDVIVFQPRSNTSPKFLFYSLMDERFIQHTIQTSKGTKMPRGDKAAILKYIAKLPPFTEQKAIAHVLGALDDKIELNRRMNETLENMAQTLFKSWFVDFDPVIDNAIAAGNPIPEPLTERAQARRQAIKNGTANREIAQTFPTTFRFTEELGWIPEGWEVKSLDQIADYKNGLALQKFRPSSDETPLPIVKIAQLKSGMATWDEVASPNITPEYIINDGDVVFSWSGSLMIDIWCGGKAALNQHLFKVVSSDFPKWFYYHWSKEHLLNFQKIAADKAVTMGHIKRGHLSEAHCSIPGERILSGGSDVLRSLSDKIIENRLQNRSLAKLRDVLLPKLISGELRIPEAGKMAEKALT